MYSVRITMSQMENQHSVTPEFQKPNQADRNQNTQMEISQSIPKNNTTEPKISNVTKQEFTPSQDQAIILQSIDGITIEEYARAIANIIGPKAIKFLSRISNDRICMYLDSKETVTSLISKYKTVVVNNKNIEIRPMVLRVQRIILSNIEPIIPNSAIENMFKRNNIKLYSKITPLKAGITDPNLAHILSFRRQVYVDPEDVNPELLSYYVRK